MTRYGYCPSCNKTFALEDQVVGKVIAIGLVALVTALAGKQVAKNRVAFAGLNVAGLALAHAIDSRLGLSCTTPGCVAVLRVVDTAFV